MKILFLIILVMVVVFVVTAINSPSQPKDEQQILSQSIISFDYNPKTNTIYYLADPKKEGTVSTFEYVIFGKYDLKTKKTTVIEEKLPYTFEPLSISKKGTVFIIDDGENRNNLTWKEENKPLLREYNDEGEVASYEITNTIESTKQEAADDMLDCKDLSDQMNEDIEFVGMFKFKDREFMPILAINTVEGEKKALYLKQCNPETLSKFKNQFISKNLSLLNEKVIQDTNAQTDYLLVDNSNDFSFKSKKKTLAYANFPCEGFYDLLEWNGHTFDMGSCVQGINGFAQSRNIFYEGKLLYQRVNGLYLLNNPNN